MTDKKTLRPEFSDILPLNENDYAEILTVWESSVRATHFFLKEKEISFYKPLIEKYALPDFELFGIKNQNNRLTGLIGLKNDKIEMLFIHPDFFRRGIGKKLTDFAINVKNCTKVDVNEENPNAFKFYQHCGFRFVSRNEKDERGKPHPILHLSL